MGAVCDEDHVDTCLFASFVEEEDVVDYWGADGHHAAHAKASDGSGADERTEGW